MSKQVLIIIAEKSETVEIVAPVDTLRRIEGIEVTIAGVSGKEPVKLTQGIVITPDVALSEVDKDAYDAIILPGGEGYVNLQASELVGEILRNQYNKGKLVASICMSANVFLAHGVGLGNKITSYPYLTEALKEKYEYLDDAVVQDKASHHKASINSKPINRFYFVSEHDYVTRPGDRVCLRFKNRRKSRRSRKSESDGRVEFVFRFVQVIN